MNQQVKSRENHATSSPKALRLFEPEQPSLYLCSDLLLDPLLAIDEHDSAIEHTGVARHLTRATLTETTCQETSTQHCLFDMTLLNESFP